MVRLLALAAVLSLSSPAAKDLALALAFVRYLEGPVGSELLARQGYGLP